MADQLGVNNTQQRLIAGNSQPKHNQGLHQVRSNDDSVVVNASEKRYLWTARAFAILTAVSLCCNLILLLTITNLMPLYRVEPYLLTLTNKEEQVYHVKTYNIDMASHDDITESFVREYILLRYTYLPDIEEMKARWGEGSDLQEMSSAMVYEEFKKSAKKYMENIEKDGLTSSVKITSVTNVDSSLWQVDYVTSYSLPNMPEPKKQKWQATLKIEYQQRVVKFKERLKNPIGFKVIKYGTKKKQ